MEKLYTDYIFDRSKVQSFEEFFKLIKPTQPSKVQNIAGAASGKEHLRFRHDICRENVGLFTSTKIDRNVFTAEVLPGCVFAFFDSETQHEAWSYFLFLLKEKYVAIADELGATIYASLIKTNDRFVGIITNHPINYGLPISDAMAAIEKGETFVTRVDQSIFLVNYSKDRAELLLFGFRSSSLRGGGLPLEIEVNKN